jgi:thiol-disulfide isomerase/thioredoxin
MASRDVLPQTVRAHELLGDFWFNSEPVIIAALRGQVILVEFWDYTSDASLRTIPYMKEWHRKYQEFGLVVVGVHTPRFPFARNPEEVQKAIDKLGIRYPVVMDNDGLLATRYDSRAWPTVFLIDRSGFLRYAAEGEGGYAATEHVIQTLLYDAGVSERLPGLMDPLRDIDRADAVCYRATPELFAGYVRGSIGNVEGYSPESVVTYADPEIYLDGRFYASGSWINERNCLRLDARSGAYGAIIVHYCAREVNAVFKPDGVSRFELEVTQDGRPLRDEDCGEDVHVGTDGRSVVTVTEARLYGLVKNPQYGEHVVRLTTRSGGCSLYSIAFVTCAIVEPVSKN